MPRVLLVVDEFQEFFVEDDKLAQEASLLLDRLVRQGRAFGMHVVLGSQTLGGAYSLARSTLGQMAVRIALQCSEADSYLIMSEDNPAPRLLSRPGEAIYNDASGMLEGNSPFQIVWLSEETREAMLDRVRERGRGRPAGECIVFEGDRASEIGRNPRLAAIREGREKPPASPTAWLGEAVSIKEATNVAFRRQAAANLLYSSSASPRVEHAQLLREGRLSLVIDDESDVFLSLYGCKFGKTRTIGHGLWLCHEGAYDPLQHISRDGNSILHTDRAGRAHRPFLVHASGIHDRLLKAFGNRTNWYDIFARDVVVDRHPVVVVDSATQGVCNLTTLGALSPVSRLSRGHV